ncbi:unnamed protein product [Paramecium pentaurelia]|uniref:Transmembrane protein n=1 Tax=Paramecium pentaurelia TaxID=43138 RepID=A0A8S1XZI7_9CILI|nr:unnamed protein product [Paramecium pentaurelia]
MTPEQVLFKLIMYLNPLFWYKFYFYETIFIVTITIFAFQYIRGSKFNKRLAKIHMNQISLELQKYFKNVGDKEQDILYEQDNPHTYKLYASNHPSMKFCLVGLYLHRRENLFNYYGYQFVFPSKERLVIEIGVQPQFRQYICFGIVKQNQIKRIKQEGYEDLKNICHTLTIPELDNSLQILTEYDEIAQQICTPEIIQLLNANQKSIHIIYISDVDRDPACKICVKVMTNLSTNPEYLNLVQLVVQLSLQIAQIKMDLKKITKAGQTRRKFNSKFKD